ncbi:ankyrin repeat domain-containing protein SOWAHD [Rhynchocyon petersi]
MTEPRWATSGSPRVSLAAPQSLPGTLQAQPSKAQTESSLNRSRSAISHSRESCHSLGMLSATSLARRRSALRELRGLQGAAPAGWLSEERAEQPPAARASGSRLCMDPLEHQWMLATAEGHFDELLELLEVEPALLQRSDPITGYTVLHWLAKHGYHEELIRLYDFAQSHGLPLDVSAPGSGGLTPLHLATQQGHDMVIKVLVGALGADTTRRDHSGHRACYYLRPDAPLHLRELSGAEEWEMVGRSEKDNVNNNSSILSGSSQRRTPSSASRKAKESIRAPAAKDKDSVGSRGIHIQGLLRQVFPFFQDR